MKKLLLILLLLFPFHGAWAEKIYCDLNKIVHSNYSGNKTESTFMIEFREKPLSLKKNNQKLENKVYFENKRMSTSKFNKRKIYLEDLQLSRNEDVKLEARKWLHCKDNEDCIRYTMLTEHFVKVNETEIIYSKDVNKVILLYRSHMKRYDIYFNNLIEYERINIDRIIGKAKHSVLENIYGKKFEIEFKGYCSKEKKF